MGFYGNVADRANEVFKFDRIFSSRYEMDLAAAAGTDNVFAGHFVLVQYDPTGKIHSGDFYAAYIGEDNIAYADEDLTHPLYFTTFSQVSNPTAENWAQYWLRMEENFYIKVPSLDYFNESGEVNYFIPDSNADKDNLTWLNRIIRAKNENNMTTDKYYYCTGANSEGLGLWTPVTNQSFASFSYFENYHIDRLHYAIDNFILGYDSTVWEKVYSGGHGTFQLVAHLNGMMPGIELYADAPSMEPSAPYIDSLSTDALYRIHTPSHWGFRIKENANQSDQTIVQTYYNYDSNNNLINSINREIAAEIYFNKDGFLKIERSYDDTTQNEILIAPTGESGKVYYTSNGITQTIDTYELSIHLPVIGNLVCDFYDIFYGENRNLDIYWYEGNDSRKNNGTITYNYKTKNLNTIAGTMNVLHDRLGQNIVSLNDFPSKTQIAGLNDEYIYAIQDSNEDINYYRKGTDYEYDEILEYSEINREEYEPDKYYIYSSSTNTYTLAQYDLNNYSDDTIFYRKNIVYSEGETLLESEYEPNTYYVKQLDNNEYVIASFPYQYYISNVNNYEHTNNNLPKFYKKNITAIKYHEVDLIGYQADTYYYFDGANYLLDHQQYAPSYSASSYYNIQESDVIRGKYFDFAYSPNAYYQLEDNGNYSIVSDSEPSLDIETFYQIVSQLQSDGSKILYQPNKYYYKQGEQYMLATDVEYDPSKAPYYFIPFTDRLVQVQDPVTGNIVVGYMLDTENAQNLGSLFSYSDMNSLYIRQNNNYIHISNIEDLTIAYQYYTITTTEIHEFFLPNKYFLYVPSSGYYLQSSFINSQTEYCQIKPLTPLSLPFYEASSYYYFNGNLYVIDFNLEKTEGRIYYTESAIYVYNDTSGRFSKGYEWKDQSLFVPASVALATRTKTSALFPLNGINNGESSVNGSILTANRIIEPVNTDTRELDTIQGALNTLKDVFSSLSTTYPGRLLYINDFGQITATSITLTELKDLFNRVEALES